MFFLSFFSSFKKLELYKSNRKNNFVKMKCYIISHQIDFDCIFIFLFFFLPPPSGIDEYIKMTIPQRKLVLGVPWYGYRYPCINLTSVSILQVFYKHQFCTFYFI